MKNKTHILKLNEKYCDDVYNGYKTFEVRYNDRNFKVGDKIRFFPVRINKLNGRTEYLERDVLFCLYKITYVLDDFKGLADGFVAFGIKRII